MRPAAQFVSKSLPCNPLEFPPVRVVKFANAFGARVVVLTTSPGKAVDAVRLDTHDVVLSRKAAQVQKGVGSLRARLLAASA